MQHPRVPVVAGRQAAAAHAVMLANDGASTLAPVAPRPSDPPGSGHDAKPDDGLTKTLPAHKYSEEELGRITDCRCKPSVAYPASLYQTRSSSLGTSVTGMLPRYGGGRPLVQRSQWAIPCDPTPERKHSRPRRQSISGR